MTRHRVGRLTLVSVAALALLAPARVPLGPRETIEESVECTLAVLDDPALQGEARTRQRRESIRLIAAAVFDFEEMARRALGYHWRSRTPDERAEFTELFTDLLQRAYMVRIEEYEGERIRYAPARMDGDHAVVDTTIAPKTGPEVPVSYRMRHEDGRWLVYDVVIEGVSLISNYRTQFDRILRTSSWQELVGRMRAKAVESPS
jgi:phospholipid transport system substrate-binding protein